MSREKKEKKRKCHKNTLLLFPSALTVRTPLGSPRMNVGVRLVPGREGRQAWGSSFTGIL